ncbi:hypothetical protein [Streptomyces sp. NPDC090022]|uniref:hypothetical protein n=1 Tax=Streptomyces sp. NPDC090022 TaxID=3365920 RepID=UPI00380F581B
MNLTKTDSPADQPADAESRTEPATDAEAAAPAVSEKPAGEDGQDTRAELDDADELEELDELDETEQTPTGVGAAACAVFAAGLGLLALSGSWVSRVLAERQTLVGQIHASEAASTEAKIEALYGDAWHLTALVNGVVSALALLLAVFVLLSPAFGAPGRVHPTWVKAVAWAGIGFGVLGLLVFGVIYALPLPSAP